MVISYGLPICVSAVMDLSDHYCVYFNITTYNENGKDIFYPAPRDL